MKLEVVESGCFKKLIVISIFFVFMFYEVEEYY